MDLDFTIIESSGLSQIEFAQLIGASRLTVNNWVNDKATPHKIYQTRAENTLGLLQQAIDGELLPGEIPAATGTTMSERRQYIRRAIRDAKRLQREAVSTA